MVPLRLALATARFWPHIGEEQTHLLRLAESLIGLGHTVSIVTPQWKRSWPQQMMIGVVPVVRLRGSARGGWGTLRWMYGLAGWLKEQRLDGVVALGLKHEAYVALGAAKKTGTPTILIAGEDDLGWQRTATLGQRIAARCHEARSVVAPTEEWAGVLKSSGFAGDCITVIRRSTAIGPPRTPKLREEARLALAAANYDLVTTASAQVALAVGRLETAQRFGDLVRAWRIVAARHSEARLWIVGDGPERETLFRQISDLDQRFRVLLPGTFECLEELFQASDMLLAPAAQAVTPLALLDAQAAGLPAVAADCPAVRSQVVEERTGLLYPAGDFKALAGAVNRLIEQPGAAVAYGATARAAAEKWPRPEEEAKAYVDLIQQLQ